MIHSAVLGVSGRMGQEIVEVLKNDSRFADPVGFALQDCSSLKIDTFDSLDAMLVKEFNTVIDFTHFDFFDEVLKWCVVNKKPLVSGTTGISKDQKAAIEEASHEIPIMWAPNMSVGVALLNHLVKHLGALNDFDFQIYETHHKHKKDAPSGTALFLQETLQKAVSAPVPEPLSLRMGGEFGHHVVKASSEEETIQLEHRALNRSVFAKGSVQAAYWLSSQPPGLYNMSDVIGI